MRRPLTLLTPLWVLLLYLCSGIVTAEPVNLIQDAGFAGQISDPTTACQVKARCRNRFTLSGLVTDSALPFAIVVVHVGSHTYTTVADANGFYTLVIETATVGDLVTIEAEADNPNDPGETVDFVNLAGTFSRLLSDPIENVTNITTAQFVLLVEANGGQAPASEQELRDAETDLDPARLLELAAVIHLIVDDPTYTLPPGFDSIVEFVADETAVDQFVADVNATDPNAIEDAIIAILANNDLVEGFVAADIPSFYYGIGRAMPGYLPRGGAGYEFDSNNFVGTYLHVFFEPVSEAFDWGVTDGVLELSFPNPTSYSSWSNIVYMPDGDTFDQSLVDEFYRCALDPDSGLDYQRRVFAMSFTRIVDGSLVDIVSRTDREELTFDPVPAIIDPPDCIRDSIQFPTILQFPTAEYTLRSSTDITPIPFTNGPAGVQVPGSWGSDYYYNPGPDWWSGSAVRSVFGNLLTFYADGTGSKLFDDVDLGDQTFTWQIAAGDLVIDYPDGWTQTVRIVGQEGKIYGVFNDFTNDTDRIISYSWAIKQDPSFGFTEAYLLSPVGKFWNGMINHWIPDWYLPDGTLPFDFDYFGWDFNQLPNGLHPYGIYREDDRVWRVFPMTWFILPDGMVQMNYVTVGWPERQRFWIPLAQEPITEDPVTGDPIVPAIRRFYVLEYENVLENQVSAWHFQPRINIQQETDTPEYDIYQYCTPNWVCTPP